MSLLNITAFISMLMIWSRSAMYAKECTLNINQNTYKMPSSLTIISAMPSKRCHDGHYISHAHNIMSLNTTATMNTKWYSRWKYRITKLLLLNTSLVPCGKVGKTTAIVWAALTNPTGACSSFVCPNNGMAASVWHFTHTLTVPVLDRSTHK